MAAGKGAETAVPFVGLLYSSSDVLTAASLELKETFGNTLLESPSFPWDYTDYYTDEIEPPVFRKFLFFQSIIDTSSIVDAKLKTMRLEARFSRAGKRRINIDPGYVTLAKVVLVSRKNYSHRIHLGKGVFAEVELFHKGGSFNIMPYTYPDYREKIFLTVFSEARSLFKKKISVKSGP